jgi:hypothetical protein
VVFVSLRRLVGAAFFCATALAANVALAAGAAPQPDRRVDMATVLKSGPLPERQWATHRACRWSNTAR